MGSQHVRLREVRRGKPAPTPCLFVPRASIRACKATIREAASQGCEERSDEKTSAFEMVSFLDKA